MANIYVGIQANISQLTAMTKGVQSFGQTFTNVARQMNAMATLAATSFTSLGEAAAAASAAGVAGQSAQQAASRTTTAMLKQQAAAYTQMSRNMGAQAFGRKAAPGLAGVANQSRYLKDLNNQYMTQIRAGATQARMPMNGPAGGSIMPIGRLDSTNMAQIAAGTQATFRQALTSGQMASVKWGALKNTLHGVGMQITSMGKNMQWTGRQMMTGFTIPLLMGIKAATSMFLQVNKEMTRIEKVGGRDLFKKFKTNIEEGIASQVRTFGSSQKAAATLTGDLVSMGYSIGGVNSEAIRLGKNIQYVAALGDVGLRTATDFYRNTMKVFVASNPAIKTFNDQLKGTNFIIDQLNQIENKTVINLSQLATAMPVAAGAAKLFGLNAAELASILTGIIDKGLPLETAATGLSFVLARIVAPTKKAGEVYDKAFGKGALAAIQNTGDGLSKIMKISQDYEELRIRGVAGGAAGTKNNEAEANKVIAEVVQRRQIKTFQPMAASLNEGNIQIREAVATLMTKLPAAAKMMQDLNLDVNKSSFQDMAQVLIKYRTEILGASNMTNGFGRALIASAAFVDTSTKGIEELATEYRKMSGKEIEIKLKSPEAKMRIMSETFKMVGASLGQAMFPALLKIGQVLLSVFEKFEKMSFGVKTFIGTLMVGLAALGPLLYLGGLAGSVFGVLFRSLTVVLPGLNMVSKEALIADYNLNGMTRSVGMVGDSFFYLGKSSNTLSQRLSNLIGIKKSSVLADEQMITSQSVVSAAMGVTEAMSAAEAEAFLQYNAAKIIATEVWKREQAAAYAIIEPLETANIALMEEQVIAQEELTLAIRNNKQALIVGQPIKDAERAAKLADVEATQAQTAATKLKNQLAVKERSYLLAQTKSTDALTAHQEAASAANVARANLKVATDAKIAASAIETEAIEAKIAAKALVRHAKEGVRQARAAEAAQLRVVNTQIAKSPTMVGHPKSVTKLNDLKAATIAAQTAETNALTAAIDAEAAAESASLATKNATTVASEEATIAKAAERAETSTLTGVRNTQDAVNEKGIVIDELRIASTEAQTLATDQLAISLSAAGVAQGLRADHDLAAVAAADELNLAMLVEDRATRYLATSTEQLALTKERLRYGMALDADQFAADTVAKMANLDATGMLALATDIEAAKARASTASLKLYDLELKKTGDAMAALVLSTSAYNKILTVEIEKLVEVAGAQEAANLAAGGGVAPVAKVGLLGRTGGLLKTIGSKTLGAGKRMGGMLIPGLGAGAAGAGAAGAGTAGAGVVAAEGGAVAAGAGFTSLLGPIALIVAAIAAVIAIVVILAKHWKEISKGMSGGINSIKKAFSAVGDAVGVIIGVFKDSFKTVSAGAEGGKKTASVWEGIGQIIGGVSSAIAWLIKGFAWIITKLAPGLKMVFDPMADAVKVVINIFQALMALFHGDWKEALGYLGRAFASVIMFMVDTMQPFIKFYEGIIKAVAIGAGWIAGLFGAKGIQKQINDFAKKLDITKSIRDGLDKLTKRKPVEVKTTFVNKTKEIRPSEVSEEKKKDSRDSSSGSGGKNPYDNFLSALQAKLGDFISSLKDMISKEFDEVWKKRLEVFDDQIKAMDEVEKKEAELLATQEYAQSRREALNKRSLDQENYRRDRGLAIYEGRIDDARNLDLTFSENDKDNRKAITDIDKSRGNVLLKASRDLQRQKIADAKKAAEDLKAIQEKALKEQIDLITQYTPKNDAEWVAMMDKINDTLTNYGMPLIAGAWTNGLDMFTLAIAQVKVDINNESFWSGEWAYTGIYSWISKLAQIDIKNIVKSMADSAKSGIDDSSLNPDSDPEDSTDTTDTGDTNPDGTPKDPASGDKVPKTVRVSDGKWAQADGKYLYRKSNIPKFGKMLDFLYKADYNPDVWKTLLKDKQFVAYLKEQKLFDMFSGRVANRKKNVSSPGALGFNEAGLREFQTPEQKVESVKTSNAKAGADLVTKIANTSIYGRAIMEDELSKYHRLFRGNFQSAQDVKDLNKFRKWQKNNGFTGNNGLKEFIAKTVLPKTGAGGIAGTHFDKKGNVVVDEGATPITDSDGIITGKGFKSMSRDKRNLTKSGTDALNKKLKWIKANVGETVVKMRKNWKAGDSEYDGIYDDLAGNKYKFWIDDKGQIVKSKPAEEEKESTTGTAKSDKTKGTKEVLGDEKKNTDKANKHGNKVGKGFTDGVEDGVKKNKEKPKKAVNGLTSEMLEHGKKSLKIESPSRVAADQIGKPFVDGIAMGIESPSSKLTFKTAVKNLLDSYDRINKAITVIFDWTLQNGGGLRSGIQGLVNDALAGGLTVNADIFTAAKSALHAFFQWIWDNLRIMARAADGPLSGLGPNGVVGPLQKRVENNPVPALALGGMVKRRMGGMLAQIGEGRYDEAVIPLPQGMSEFVKSFKSAQTAPSDYSGMSVNITNNSAPATPQAMSTNIYVDNFIGEPAWFESMMKEYGVKVAPKNQQAYGTINRKVTSYQDNSQRSGRI
jgi:hypothetical protein